ncbi:hypothetical protein BOX15_Mlig032818g1 [Macrostomum lignano]|uniref:Uncharacterized protein n=2 Tax=Macrostomum lignano TaxID=282301 RepID=A0A267E277_9PLAT|nr:hypothetical protein BOX15_Mlig032818g2 [Macrostomum lignano]PAA70927.1 hypothetical protein BOX15_Mlig032818g1 [Macrostomum lignano]
MKANRSTNNSATPVIRTRPKKLLSSFRKSSRPRFRVCELYLQMQQQRDWRQQFEEMLELENRHCCCRTRNSKKASEGFSFESNRSLDGKARGRPERKPVLEYQRLCRLAANSRLPRMPSNYRKSFSPRKRPERHVLQSRMRLWHYRKNPCCVAAPLPGSDDELQVAERQQLANVSNTDTARVDSAAFADNFFIQSGGETCSQEWHCCRHEQVDVVRWSIALTGDRLEAEEKALSVRVQLQRSLLARKVRQPEAAEALGFEPRAFHRRGGWAATAAAVASSVARRLPSAAVCELSSESEASAVISAATTLTAATTKAAQATSGQQPAGGSADCADLSSCSRFSCRTPSPSDQTSLLLRGSDIVSMATETPFLPQLIRVSWMEEASVTSSSTSVSSCDMQL